MCSSVPVMHCGRRVIVWSVVFWKCSGILGNVLQAPFITGIYRRGGLLYMRKGGGVFSLRGGLAFSGTSLATIGTRYLLRLSTSPSHFAHKRVVLTKTNFHALTSLVLLNN
jgi:hypothetical protein